MASTQAPTTKAAQKAAQIAELKALYPNAPCKYFNNPETSIVQIKQLKDAVDISQEQKELVERSGALSPKSLCLTCGNTKVKARYTICFSGKHLACDGCHDGRTAVFCPRFRGADKTKCGFCADEGADTRLLPAAVPCKALDDLAEELSGFHTDSLTVALHDDSTNRARRMDEEAKRREMAEKIKDLEERLASAEGEKEKAKKGEKRPRSESTAEERAEKRAKAEEKRTAVEAVRELERMLEKTVEFVTEHNLLDAWREEMADVQEAITAEREREEAEKKAASLAKRRATIAKNAEKKKRASDPDSDAEDPMEE